MAANIKKTQKRANALKNITIPHYEALAKSISEALEEKEREDFTRLMLQTGELTTDVGSVLYGEQAVELGLIDRVGNLRDALDCLHEKIAARREAP